MMTSRRELIASGLTIGAGLTAAQGVARAPPQSASRDAWPATPDTDGSAKSGKETTLEGRRFSYRQGREPAVPAAADLPLVVALHGGTYTSRYFDVPGYSLLARAESLHLPIIAFDRPGYGRTPIIAPADASLVGNAAIFDAALGALWRQEGRGRTGVVLIGHSIGAAIVAHIAARQPRWPLLGIAVSGLALVNAPDRTAVSGPRGQIGGKVRPRESKDLNMFGTAGSFVSSAPDATRVADAPMPQQEAIDIRTKWAGEARGVLARVEVPVHYRQGAQDRLWAVGSKEVEQFAAACSASPFVDARLVQGSGHCIDFHRIGASFQIEQLAFSLRCAFDRAWSPAPT